MPGTESLRPDGAPSGDVDPGADGTPDTRTQLVDRLTLAGWLLLTGELGFILFQLQRVRTADGTRFASAWSQRIEVLGFTMLPPNLVVLAPAVATAVVAVFMAGTQRGPWLDALLRVAAATSITMFFIGLVANIEILTRDGDVEIDSIFLRLGGMGLAAGFAVVCRAADHASRARLDRR